nr:PAS domain-containing sensor histidine kinase [uncultured Mucilaginibacter sp.]
MFGFYPGEKMTYEDAIAQIVNEHKSLVTDAVEASINTGNKCDVEYCLRGFHDGKLRWVRGIGNLTHDQEGKSRYFTGLLIDITVHKQDELRKNDFIGMASHELKTPLTSLQAYIQMLAARAKKAEDAFAVNALAKASTQVKKMITLINGFLNVSSFEAGKIYLNEQTFELNDLLNEIVEDFMLTTTSHNVLLLPSPALTVYADKDKIGQVISNFLNNAMKYSPNGKNIKLTCIESEGMAKVSVTDEGIGVNAYDQEKLFDRYFRVENEQTQLISGFGLGLYLSAEIIRRHKGEVWVESEVGQGAAFYFSLPLAQAVSV